MWHLTAGRLTSLSTEFLSLNPCFCFSGKCWCRAANIFPAGAGQIVRSNLFLLGHIPFLAGQTSITSYWYKSAPSSLHMMFKYETSKFSKHLLYMSIDLNAGKVERMVQQNQYHICAYCYCLSSTSYIRLHSFFFYKNVVFPAQAEYFYFSADFRLKIFLYYS